MTNLTGCNPTPSQIQQHKSTRAAPIESPGTTFQILSASSYIAGPQTSSNITASSSFPPYLYVLLKIHRLKRANSFQPPITMNCFQTSTPNCPMSTYLIISGYAYTTLQSSSHRSPETPADIGRERRRHRPQVMACVVLALTWGPFLISAYQSSWIGHWACPYSSGYPVLPQIPLFRVAGGFREHS